MTRLEKLEMQGFKSFSRKTVLSFPSNFLVICGPNASGKSNILDAVIFVLGRSSAKGLRADRMLEMIFHGGQSKKPAEIARVNVQFNNSNNEFSLEEDKIIISRRVNKNGVSIYKLNGRTVTKETIKEVLRPARIHPEGHNIILQGDVTNVIEMGAIERREIIDEISGIKEFDEKRDKSQRELMTVEQRLKESSIILHEKRSQLTKLEIEKRAASEYQKLTKELDKLRASLAKQKLQDAETAMEKLDERIKKVQTTDYDKELEKFDKEIGETEKKIDQINKRLFDRSKEIAIIKEVEKLRSEIRAKQNKIEMSKSEIIRIEDTIKRLEQLRQREIEEVSRAVKDVLNLGWTGVYGAISSLSKVSKKYEEAIEVAAGSHLNDIIVSNENVAIECVKYLKMNKIGRATFLPLDKIKPRDSKKLKKFLYEDGVIGLAIDLIEFNNKYYNAFSFVFGDTLIIDDIGVAKRLGIGNARFVTLDGDLVEKSGAIIGGFYRKKKAFIGTEEIEKYVSHKKQLEKEIDQLEKEIEKMKKELEHLTTEELMGSKELTQMQKERENLEKNYESMKKKRKRLFEERMESQERINTLRINKARLEAELDNLKLEFENYKKTETYKLPIETIEKRIKETMNSINSLGAINMKALEEYEEQKVIYEDLKSKVEKLTEERNKILEIIVDIESKRKESFMKTLDELREQFKIVFRDLTNGNSDLRLLGDMDSGLIIEANPGGKKLLNIDAMSGGEKTITALAFLFAIQRIKPAPFYILDEVDAALDKPNTKKIIELIKKYSSDSQFIVISHNETTIQAADAVYGVSMEEGESRIVGIRMPS